MRLIVLLIVTPFLLGATYYADYTTGADNNAGTQESPWKYAPGMSGWTGSATLQNGDTVVLKGGITWEFESKSDNLWNLPAQITVKGGQQLVSPWGSGYPTLDGSGSTGARYGIYVNKKSNITIDGIKIYNIGYSAVGNGQGMFFVDGSNITIKNCHFDTYAVNALSYNFSAAGISTSAIYVHDNLFTNNGRVVFNPGDGTVDDFRFYNNLYEGPGLYAPQGYHCDGLMVGMDGTEAGRVFSNMKIYNNKFYGDWHEGATAAIYMNGTTGYVNPSTTDTYIYNNVIAYENNSCDFALMSPGMITVYMGIHTNVNIFNNTISADACVAKPPNGINLIGVVGANVKNNIISGVSNAIIIAEVASGTIDINYNLYNTAGGNYLIWDNRVGIATRCNTIADCRAAPVSQEANGIANTTYSATYPKFVALPSGGTTGTGNWSIMSSSPARDAGDTIASFSTDILGTTRTGTWDIGAYEYSSGGGAGTVGLGAGGTITFGVGGTITLGN